MFLRDYSYCPIPIGVETYNKCFYECVYCIKSDKELKPVLTNNIINIALNKENKLNSKEKIIYNLIQKRKPILIGDRFDPYPPAEQELENTRNHLLLLSKLNCPIIIKTKNIQLLHRDLDIIKENDISVIIHVNIGFNKDYLLLEDNRLPNILNRLDYVQFLLENKVNVSVSANPFIPLYHTIKDIELFLCELVKRDIKAFSLYPAYKMSNLLKNIFYVIGLSKSFDFSMNDLKVIWGRELKFIIELCRKYQIDFSTPDYVNTQGYIQKTNTCCGLNIRNINEFNVMTCKKKIIEKYKVLDKNTEKELFDLTFDGLGNKRKDKYIILNELKKIRGIYEI